MKRKPCAADLLRDLVRRSRVLTTDGHASDPAIRPTRHPPGTPAKVAELATRRRLKLPLYHHQDAKIGSEALADSHLPFFEPGEVEQLTRLGYDIQSFGRTKFPGEKFTVAITERTENGVVVVAEIPHEGRHRSEKEKEKAAAPAALAADAARKRQARAARAKLKETA